MKRALILMKRRAMKSCHLFFTDSGLHVETFTEQRVFPSSIFIFFFVLEACFLGGQQKGKLIGIWKTLARCRWGKFMVHIGFVCLFCFQACALTESQQCTCARMVSCHTLKSLRGWHRSILRAAGVCRLSTNGMSTESLSSQVNAAELMQIYQR